MTKEKVDNRSKQKNVSCDYSVINKPDSTKIKINKMYFFCIFIIVHEF